MRRRTFTLAWIAALSLAGALGAKPSASVAEELHTAAAEAVAPAAHPAPVGPVVAQEPVGTHVGLMGVHATTCIPRDYLHPHLFYNFYVGGNCGSIPAAMYPSPMPTPPLVGHTFYTYQPLLPHEFMYAHKRVYHHHYNHNRGLHRTRVIWAW